MKRRSRRSLGALAAAAAMLAGIVVTANPAAAASLVWTGAGGAGWSNATSWSPQQIPAAGDVLTFPASPALLVMNNDIAANTPVTLNFNGAGYNLGGNSLSVASITQSVAGTNQILAPIGDPVTGTLGNTPVAIASGGILNVASVSGALGITKTGLGKFSIAAGSYTGGTLVGAGQFIVNGAITGPTVVAGGLLGGTGATGPVNATSGIINAGDNGPGLLTVNGNLTLNAGVQAGFDITGAAIGTQFDQIRVIGGVVTLSNATLSVSGSFVGANGSQFVIIDNQGGSAIQGTFSGLAEGAQVSGTNGQIYTISYKGGAGANDVVLTQISASGGKAVVLGGADRIDTAILISKNSFPTAGSANAVVLARADLFPDALAGAPLAVAKGGPLELTSLSGPSFIDPRTVAEIQRVLTTGKTIFVLGGTAAIADNVVAQLQALGYQVIRLGGTDRFQTAVLIAQNGLNNPVNLFLANGINFPDALSAGPSAAKVGGAILLTNNNLMPAFTQQYLSTRTGATLFAMGGPAAGAAPQATPIVGADRYATAVMAAQRFFTNPTAVGIASGVAFPDGLTGGAHIGKLGGPLLLTDPNALPGNVQTYLTSIKTTLTQLFVYGGPAAVATPVVTQINTAVA